MVSEPHFEVAGYTIAVLQRCGLVQITNAAEGLKEAGEHVPDHRPKRFSAFPVSMVFIESSSTLTIGVDDLKGMVGLQRGLGRALRARLKALGLKALEREEWTWYSWVRPLCVTNREDGYVKIDRSRWRQSAQRFARLLSSSQIALPNPED